MGWNWGESEMRSETASAEKLERGWTRTHAIRPGRPDESYLLYRMDSVDPGIAMPELGRGTIDAEGLALIRAWIAAMPDASPPTGAVP